METLENYGKLDRLIHRIAFSSPGVQLAAAEIEDKFLARETLAGSVAPPIFITSLPRAGTTITLSALNRLPQLATHTYRNMPFIMAPVLWDKLSSGFRKETTLSERAHGDGIQIGYDSPEAFEEVIWRAFWPDHYKQNTITLWRPEDGDAEASLFLCNHIKKITGLHHSSNPNEVQEQEVRYISKNNANIARLELLNNMFPDAKIIVPVRNPIAHAQSLLRTHLNFLDQHKKAPFVKRYMGDIGHYEFGELHKLIQFPDTAKLTAGFSSAQFEYWLGYWTAAFQYVLAHRNIIEPVCYEDLCNGGQKAAKNLIEKCGIETELTSMVASEFRPVKTTRDRAGTDKAMLKKAFAIYDKLRS